ncbi:MAG: Mov34/MPN/PAD-1 family protein [Chloroflexota bacterium]|nr:MAG: Mov34/MPN/PAD-1 family protein [Chloroflexota bacterium]
MTEQCWVLLGAYDENDDIWRLRLRRHVAGQPASVEADWCWTLEREEHQGDVAGFAHTHPPGAGTAPSDRDVKTMMAWCGAFGKPLLCLIAEGEALRDPAAYLFQDDQQVPEFITRFELLDERTAAHD